MGSLKSDLTQVNSSGVIKLILQFLKESNLKRSLLCLQEESGVTLNAVDSIITLENSIMKGKWDCVLQTLSVLDSRQETLYLIYEQIICELMEENELNIAKSLLTSCKPLISMKNEMPIRYRSLENLIKSGDINEIKRIYQGLTKEKRRSHILKELVHDVDQVPASRLLSLLGMALKWENQHGHSISDNTEEDEKIENIARVIKFGKEAPGQCLCFSPSGEYLVTGSTDGLIEVWDWTTGNLTNDLMYQREETLLGHRSAVLAICFSEDMSLLASGCQDGDIKIWDFQSGKCIKYFTQAHDQGVSCLCFNKDNSFILSGSFDFAVRLHGFKTGKTIRHYTGHTSYINAVIFHPADKNKIISGSSDGLVKIWDIKSGDCILSFSPPPPSLYNPNVPLSILSIFSCPKESKFGNDFFFVCTKSNTVYLMTDSGQVQKKYCSGKIKDGNFVTACTSSRGQWLYTIGEDYTMYTFCCITGSLEAINHIHDSDVITMCHHPSSSILASISFDGILRIMQP